MIEELVDKNKILSKLIFDINNEVDCSIMSASNTLKYSIINEYDGIVFLIVSSEEVGLEFANNFILDNKKVETIFNIPSPLSNQFIQFDIIKKLKNISDGNVSAVIVTPNILFGQVILKEELKNYYFNICVNDILDRETLEQQLSSKNFSRVDFVEKNYEYSLMGESIEIGIFDKSYRIIFDFDKINKIFELDILTKDIIEKLNYLEIYADKFNFDKNKCVNILEYFKDDLIVFDGTKVIYDELKNNITDYNALIDEKKLNIKKIEINNILNNFKNHTKLALESIYSANKFFAPKSLYNINSLSLSNYFERPSILLNEIKRYSLLNYTIILCVGSDNIKYQKLLIEYDCILCSSISKILKGGVNLLSKTYSGGGIFTDEKLIIYGTPFLFGHKKRVEKTSKFIDLIDELPKANDIVVHTNYGVGRCLGIECLNLTNSKKDYVIIEYAGNDKFYLPVENINEISKFIGAGSYPKLNKLGSKDFENTKSRAKASMRKMASDLLAIYKKREEIKGLKFSLDDEFQLDFENSFGFIATPDQEKAVQDIKKDMMSAKVIDRLICGDVGYGKTEVALRIAFKTILAGYQVAILCPTTILSEQHYSTAKLRFKDFGINVQVVNRFKKPNQINNIFSEVESGNVDLIIGTHKLLNKNLTFKNLGLIILDEEQKFGVLAKDKLKLNSPFVNVITLSATPIPRTLNMSLSGIHDISVIETPPKSRIPTVVSVLEISDELLIKAINFELFREGQVLIIYNRVETIFSFASHIKSLIVCDSIAVAHGQMGEKELENEIIKLYSGETKILIATTLIENGVDLPNANTLIVINADTLGLSTLYQLKGRVGRSDRQAFAYFTYEGKKDLNDSAYKRLSAITEFAGLGSGFKIALKDLEIRGAGSVLGLEQSGHMQKIGYHMYIELLNQSIDELKGCQSEKTCPKIDTDIDAYISNNYIEKDYMRVKFYNRISKIENKEDFEKIKIELTDTLGFVPVETINIMIIGYIKNIAKNLGITRIIFKENTKKIELLSADKINSNYLNKMFTVSYQPNLLIINIDKIKYDLCELLKVIKSLIK